MRSDVNREKKSGEAVGAELGAADFAGVVTQRFVDELAKQA